jgi:hypothetical protein
MYGKIFESLYEGSMVGAGAVVFAVWGYVIAHMRADGRPGQRHDAQVDLNPKLLGFIIGEPEAEVEKAIEWLCAPDPRSRTHDEDGKRLVKVGQYSYRVVNGAKYMDIRDGEERREYFREAKRKERAMEKIAQEEAIQDKVREKFNPNYTQGPKAEQFAGMEGLTAREMVAKSVANDPMCKKDRAAMRKKFGKGADAKAPNAVEREYDMDCVEEPKPGDEA